MTARPYMVVRANIDPSVLDEFERWYRSVHLAHVMEIPGVVKAYRCNCTRRGINWATLYELADDGAVEKAITSREADRARRDWERWLPHVQELTVEVYAALGPLPNFHHWN